MKRKLSALLFFLSFCLFARGVRFDRYFIDRTMRIDYYHTGDAKEEWITIDKVYQQGTWAGSTVHLIDTFNNGQYYVKVFDLATNQMIFSRGYNTYFAEYKTTEAALKGVKRTYHETILIPYPKRKIQLTIELRGRDNILRQIFTTIIDPADISIVRDSLSRDVKVFKFLYNGDPHKKVDLAFIAEGYTARQEEKFKRDMKRLIKIFFSQEPYKTYMDRFNIYGVFKASQESGCDEPTHGVYKNTVLSSSFNSLGSYRYLLTEDNRTLRDIAAHVPYDALLIPVNHTRYGGGGIYNFYCIFTVNNRWTDYLMLHEFGHSFAGLADEYYSASVAYSDFYPPGTEPVEPNITAHPDPENIKWKSLLTPGIQIPTPWNKAEFDKMESAYQKKRAKLHSRIAELYRKKAPQEEIKEAEKELEKLSLKHDEEVRKFMERSKFRGKVGAFEGAGYVSKGMYRPMIDCIMFSKGKKPYCKVCENAIIRMIKYYTE